MREFKTFKHALMVTASCAIAFSAFGNTASAQSIDYSTMEELFGEPVTTSGNGSPQRVSDVALSMDIMTAEELARTGAKNIPEALRFMPGVDVRQHSIGQYEVGIRGYNQGSSERILVLVNGRQVYTDFFGQVVWDNIPVEIGEIKQIEVVKGPNTALFGFNAVSGVINIITYNPLHDDVKEVSVSAGSKGFLETSGVFSHKFSDRIGVKVSGGFNDYDDDFDKIKDPINLPALATADTERESVAVDVWMQIMDNVQGQVELTKNDHVRNEYLVTHGASATEYDSYSARGRVLADTSFGLIEADLYHNELRADYDLQLLTGQVPLQADNRITVAKLSNTFELGTSHVFRLATEYRKASNIFTSTAASLDQDDLTYDIGSGSALWDWQATDKLRTSAAVRYDYFRLEPDGTNFVAPGAIGTFNPNSNEDYDQVREEVSYNIGASYKIDDINTVKASHSRGADLPSFTELGLQFFTPAATAPNSGIYGDPNTKTSIVTNYEIGYDRQIPSINGLFRSAIFYQENEDMQAFGADVSSGALDLALLGNIGDSDMYGIELGLEGVYQDRWNWGANYTYVDIDDDLSNTQNTAQRSSSATYEDTVSNHIFNAHLGYLGDGWRADIFGQYRSSFDDVVDLDPTTNNELALQEVNDQIIVNANFAYDITDQITWSVSGTSITGNTQQTVEADAEAIVWSSLKFKF